MSCRRSGDALAMGEGRGSGARLDIQLHEDIGDVLHRRVVADKERVSDLAVASSVSHESQDVKLPWGQAAGGATRARVARLAMVCDHRVGQVDGLIERKLLPGRPRLGKCRLIQKCLYRGHGSIVDRAVLGKHRRANRRSQRRGRAEEASGADGIATGGNAG